MYRLRQFMQGRYGLDSLSIALVISGAVLTFFLSFTPIRYYRLLGLIPYVLVALRALSTSIDRRQRENDAFLRVWIPVKKFFVVRYRHFKDKEHKFFKCPNCKRTLRVPKNKGKIQIDCPHCGEKFKRRT